MPLNKETKQKKPKLLLLSLSLGFRHEVRETQFVLCSLFHLTQQTRVRTPPQTTGLASPRLESQLAPSNSKSQLTAFIQNH